MILLGLVGLGIYFAIRPDKLRMVADKICEWRGHNPSKSDSTDDKGGV